MRHGKVEGILIMKQMKTKLAVILIFALIISGIQISIKKADAENSVTVYGNAVTAAVGKEVRVPVLIKDNQGLAGLALKVSYDENIMTPVKVEKGEVLSGLSNLQFGDSIASDTESSFDCIAYNDSNFSDNGELFILTFQILAEAVSGTYELALELTEHYDETFEDVSVVCENISITVGDAGTPSVAPATKSPLAEVLDDFDIYIGYANTEWTENFFTDKARSIKIIGDGFYSVSFTAESSTEDIEVLTLDTRMNKQDVPSILEIVPSTLIVGGTEYSLGKCDVAGDENGYYRIDIRNPYDELFATNQALGKTLVPVHAGDIVRIDFTVAGMGKINSEAKPEATQQPMLPDTTNNPSNSAHPKASAMPSASASSPAITKEPELETPEKVKKPSKPGRVKITVCKSKRKRRINLKWKNVSESKGYRIQYARKRSFAGKKTGRAYGNSSVLYGLKSKKTYYIRIRAYKYGNSANNYKHVYGGWSKVRKVKVK